MTNATKQVQIKRNTNGEIQGSDERVKRVRDAMPRPTVTSRRERTIQRRRDARRKKIGHAAASPAAPAITTGHGTQGPHSTYITTAEIQSQQAQGSHSCKDQINIKNNGCNLEDLTRVVVAPLGRSLRPLASRASPGSRRRTRSSRRPSAPPTIPVPLDSSLANPERFSASRPSLSHPTRTCDAHYFLCPHSSRSIPVISLLRRNRK